MHGTKINSLILGLNKSPRQVCLKYKTRISTSTQQVLLEIYVRCTKRQADIRGHETEEKNINLAYFKTKNI